VAQQIKSSPQLTNYINDLNVSSNGQLNLCLDKVVFITAVIRNVINRSSKYGIFTDSDLEPLMDFASNKYVLNANNNNNDQWLTSLDCLRWLVTTTHLHRLILANG